MVVKSPQGTIHIPKCHLATLIFKSPHHPLPTDRRCFIDATKPETHYLTCHTFRLWAKRFAAGLRAAGLRTGDRVLLFSPNQLFYPVAFMGVIMAGGVFTGANPTYTAGELAHQIRDSGAKFVLCQRGAAFEVCCESAAIVGLDLQHIYVFDDGIYDSISQDGQRGCQYWGSLIASIADGERFVWDALDGEGEAQRTLALNYSSGTTGLSKGVEITHRNYTANVSQYNHKWDLNEEWVSVREDDPTEKWLCFLPFYHAMAQMIFVGVASLRQTPVYLMTKFDFITMLKNIERFRISHLTLVPPVVVALAKSPETQKYDLSSVRRVGSGAAPLSREVCEQVEALWPPGTVNIKQGWGMTETTCSAMGWNMRLKSYTHSVGWPNANSEAKIMSLSSPEDTDPDRHVPQELGPNQVGELWVRGPQMMKGYWRNPKATAEALTKDGWLRSGDIAFYDEEKKFFVTGRLKELIKVKGMQVAPAELDGVCLEVEGVADAAVCGVTINGEEHPRAYIVLKSGVPAQPQTARRIKDSVDAKLTRHKHITGGIVFTDALPKNPSGKILRRLLRERAQREIEAEAKAGKARL